ncbi:hypothetical protein EGW08_007151 [Elysia chlorotica]|uniref:Major facilitator superfamily (MFS) profile domain-containing protein n=1 Tax=Elysia chlorotica TaxID=188477 RepID=A0A433TU82_ELYCH|nr:hypothetical protein EGW08_007151 [Elysia chlorotica]
MEGGVWGIVIIISAFMIQFLAFGTTATIGVYNMELLEYFPDSTIGVSLIASLNYGIFLGSGPIVSFLMTRFSYRKIAIFGSFLVVLGLLGMPLLPYIPTMCICFGVLAGFGSCCAYIPSHVLSGMYYDKNRSLATGVATSGSGLGGAVMPVVAGLLIEVYSWKGSLIVVAALCLHMFIFSALLRMPDPNLNSKEEDAKDVDEAANKLGQAVTKKKRKGPKSARHVYIFTHYGFNIYFLSNIMWNAACSIVSSFAPEYLRSQGLTSMEAAILLGAFGFGCFVGGVLGGILGNVSWVNRQVLYTLANIFMGCVLIAFPSMGHRDLYLICLLVSGLAFGIILGLLIIVLTDLIGVESLSNGLGYLMLSNGIGTFIGPPLAGILKETTGGFESGIVLAGVLCVCGGLIMLLMPCGDMFNKLCATCCCCCKKPKTQETVSLEGMEFAAC